MIQVSRVFLDDNTTVSLSYRNQFLTVSYSFSHREGCDVVARQQLTSDVMNEVFDNIDCPYNVTILFDRPDENTNSDLLPNLKGLLSCFEENFGIRVRKKYAGLSLDALICSIDNQEVARVLKHLPLHHLGSLDFVNSRCLYIYDVYKIHEDVYKICDTFDTKHMYRGIVTLISLKCRGVSGVAEVTSLVIHDDIVVGYKMPYYGVNIRAQHMREAGDPNASDKDKNRLRQLHRCIKQVHESGFLHGDITLSNVLVDSNLDVVLIDINSRVKGMEDDWEGFQAIAKNLLGEEFDLNSLGC